jgi:hypothetical protein
MKSEWHFAKRSSTKRSSDSIKVRLGVGRYFGPLKLRSKDILNTLCIVLKISPFSSVFNFKIYVELWVLLRQLNGRLFSYANLCHFLTPFCFWNWFLSFIQVDNGVFCLFFLYHFNFDWFLEKRCWLENLNTWLLDFDSGWRFR